MAWKIDPAHTSIGFTARHMGFTKVRGQFRKFEGQVEGDPGDLTTAKGRLEIDMSSVDTGNENRDAHLRSPDFFDTDNHATMVFESKTVTRDGDLYRVVGDLTIRGVTREVELEYEHGGEGVDPYGNRKLGGSLSGTIRRTDWGLGWNVPLDGGGWLVSDKIDLDIDLQVSEVAEEVNGEERSAA